MDRIIDSWKSNYFTEIVLFVTLLIALSVALKYVKKLPELRYIPFYLILFIILMINDYLVSIFFFNSVYHKIYLHYVDGLLNFVVTLFEYLILTHYIVISISTLNYRKLLLVNSIVTISLFLIIILRINQYSKLEFAGSLHLIYIVETLSLFISCLFYFLDLYISPQISNLKQTPSFWIVIGVFIYAIGTLPLSIITQYLFVKSYERYNNMYSLIYFFYSILFLMIIRSFLCKPLKTI